MADDRTVWKYAVPIDGQWHTLTVPSPARIVHIGSQDPGSVNVWAEVSRPGDGDSSVMLCVFGTGHVVEGEHMGTVLDGPFVWHVYQKPVAADPETVVADDDR